MTKLFFTDKPIIGLDISSTSAKVMSIDVQKYIVTGYGSIDLDPVNVKASVQEKSSYLLDNIKLLLAEKVTGDLLSHHVAMSVPTSKSYNRTFNLPVKLSGKIKNAVHLEVEQYIPIPESALYIDYKVVESNKKDLTVMMSAITRNLVDRYIDIAEQAGLIVSLVEPGMSSAARIINSIEDGVLPSVIVDIGPATTDIAIVEDGAIRVTSSLSVGGNSFTLSIAKKLGVTLENAHQLKVLNGLNTGNRQTRIKNAIQPLLDQILTEVRKVMRYYEERMGSNRKLEQLLIVGIGSNMPGIGEYFTNDLVLPARVASPWQKLDFGKLPEPPRQLKPLYLTVAGLASLKSKEIWR